MNLHLILFFLIRLALAVNLPDSKPPPVRKCNSIGDCDGNPNQVLKPTGNLQATIKSVKQFELNKPDKPPSGQNGLPKKKNGQRKRTSIGVRDARGDAKLGEFILRLNKELYEKVRRPPVDQSDQINRLKIASDKVHPHDQQHSQEHNAQHAQLKKQNNAYVGLKEQDELSNYLKEQKVRELQRQAFDSLQQIFEIDLPANPTFNQKFIELITALLSELRHIKSRLWQANCKMRLSFTNQQIFSDCETNYEEPCNCPKAAVAERPDESGDREDESGEHYQAISSEKRSIKPDSVEQEKATESFATSDESSAGNESSGGPLTKNAAAAAAAASPSSTGTVQNQTEIGQFSADSSESSKKRSASRPASETAKTSPALIPSAKSTENKSKKETELSKQLRSAIDCFLCKHQWTNCLNYGIKCPAE